MKGKCFDCFYWDNGSCRKNPPTVIGGEILAAWPITTGDDWCGEFIRSTPDYSHIPDSIEHILNQNIDALGIKNNRTRIINCLGAGWEVKTIKEAASISDIHLLMRKDFGRSSLVSLKNALDQAGITESIRLHLQLKSQPPNDRPVWMYRCDRQLRAVK